MSSRIVEDSKVVTVWNCHCLGRDCRANVVEVTVDFFQDNGTPVCGECDRDMNYDHTYIVE